MTGDDYHRPPAYPSTEPVARQARRPAAYEPLLAGSLEVEPDGGVAESVADGALVPPDGIEESLAAGGVLPDGVFESEALPGAGVAGGMPAAGGALSNVRSGLAGAAAWV